VSDDPLWLHSPGKRLLFRGGCYLLAIALLAGLMYGITRSATGALAGAGAMLIGIVVGRGWIGRTLDRLASRFRAAVWGAREGRHHSFAGVPLSVHDDGRTVWLDEAGVRRLLGLTRDPADALKARFSGQWREARELGLGGRGLWLSAAAVHQLLADAPERMDPKRVRLRSYIDREILQPAARRHARGG